ncbi:AI-2E family transporter [Candidatus Allofournierella merdavium]|uniref:AI-2E family transporter n=1 Tax=Candidatus Allofournierella merdavium TaxID=2838593 RepID=UPI00374F4A39
MQLDKKTIRTLLLMAGFCIVLYWALQNLDRVSGILGGVWGLVSPFALGGSLAFILNVPMRAIEKKLPKRMTRFRRAAALTLTLLAVVGVLALVLLLIIPQLGRTIASIGARLPAFWAESQKWLAEIMERYPVLEEWISSEFITDWESAIAAAVDWFKNGGFALVGNAATAATGVVRGFVNFFIGLIFAMYLLVCKETLTRQAKMLLYAWTPAEKADKAVEVARLTNRTFSKFLSGQCLEACILGGLFAVGMLLCRMPYVTLVSVLVAVTALIPVFGAFIGCVVGAFLILVQNPMQAVWFVVLFLCIQQIEGNLIYPRVVGNSVGLPGIWVLMAVTVGGSAMGVVGMLVMIPACSVAYSLLRTATRRKLRQKGVDREKYQP